MELYPELRLILAILTCYRLARMLSQDDGPLYIFKRIRYYFKDKAWFEAEYSGWVNILQEPQSLDDRWFGWRHNLEEGISCPYCVGVWLSVPIFFLIFYPTHYGDLFLILMSISAGQSFLEGLRIRL